MRVMQRPIKLLGLSVGLGGVLYLIWRWQQSRKWWQQIHFRFVQAYFITEMLIFDIEFLLGVGAIFRYKPGNSGRQNLMKSLMSSHYWIVKSMLRKSCQK